MGRLAKKQIDLELGKRARALRESLGYPLMVFGYLADIDRNKIWMLEKWGVIPPKREDREKIAEALGVPYEELWAGVQE